MTQSQQPVVFDFTVNKMRCTHCGASAGITYPILAADLVAMTQAFIANHQRCRPAVDRKAGPLTTRRVA